MKILRISAVVIAFASVPLAALAHRDHDDDGGHGKHRHGRSEYKHEYWDGNCKVKIKQKHGDYKEERKCKGPEHVHAAPVYVVPQPVVVAPQPVYVPAVEPGVTIRATIPIK